MSQSKNSQQSFHIPDLSLPDNFFSNFEEITKKYNNLELKLNNTNDNIELKDKNDSFVNDINNIKFHSLNKVEDAELIFDFPKAKKVYKNQRKKDIEENDKNIFKRFLKSDTYYINKNKKYYNNENWDIETNSNSNYIIPDLKHFLRPQSWDDDVQFINQHLYNNKSFKPLQREIINAFLMTKNIFVFIPQEIETSICYQIPSIISNDSINIVILPSCTLINEQTKFLHEMGINYLNLELYDDMNISNINIGKNFYNENLEERVKIIYTTPEKLNKNKNISDFLIKLYNDGKIKGVIIERVNYMSQWEKNFRQDYFELKKIIETFKKTNFLLFSSNPSIRIRDELINLLNMKNLLYFKYTYNKPNLFLEVRDKKDIEDFVKIIKKNYENKNGIIYCNSQNDCKKIAEIMNGKYNINCECYYEGLINDKKKKIENKWIKDEIKVLITNIDFGEEINKIDIRFIIHYGIPKTFKLYYKQIKKAGLDREPSRCILYYDNLEQKVNKIFISKKIDYDKEKSEELRELTKMIDYCEEKYECRRDLLLSYFKENFNKEKCYRMCDNCNKNKDREKIECTKECKIILGLLLNLKNKNNNINLTFDQIIDYLKGINKYHLDKRFDNNYFGNLSKYTKDEINKMISYLIIEEYIDEYIINKNSLISSSLKINNFGEKIYKKNDTVMKITLGKIYNNNNDDNAENKNNNIVNQEKSIYHRNFENNIYYRNKSCLKNEYKIENTKDYGLCEPTEFDDLFEQLKNIRRDILKKENEKRKNNSIDGSFIPLNLDDIFSDIGLKELVRKLPTKKEDFLKENILGINEDNLEQYGVEFLPAIVKFINIYNIDINKRKKNRINNLYENEKYSNYDEYDEEDNKIYNDKNCLFLGFKRDKYDNKNNENIKCETNNNNIFKKLANKTKKNKKAKFL